MKKIFVLVALIVSATLVEASSSTTPPAMNLQQIVQDMDGRVEALEKLGATAQELYPLKALVEEMKKSGMSATDLVANVLLFRSSSRDVLTRLGKAEADIKTLQEKDVVNDGRFKKIEDRQSETDKKLADEIADRKKADNEEREARQLIDAELLKKINSSASATPISGTRGHYRGEQVWDGGCLYEYTDEIHCRRIRCEQGQSSGGGNYSGGGPNRYTGGPNTYGGGPSQFGQQFVASTIGSFVGGRFAPPPPTGQPINIRINNSAVANAKNSTANNIGVGVNTRRR